MQLIMKDMVNQMRKGKNVIKVAVLILIFGCSSNHKISQLDKENINVLYSILNNSNDVYYKTIIEDLGKSLDFQIEPYLLEFSLCDKNINLGTTKISNKEIIFLKKEFKTQSIIRIDKIDPSFKNKTTKRIERFKTVRISMPIVFRNGSMAIYYSNSTYGGGFSLLQKEDNRWKAICSNSVWIE
jgi:hypothetical protein